MCSLPERSNEPSVGVLSGTPMPRKESADSTSIKLPIANAIATAKAGKAFSKMCFHIILELLDPRTRADSINDFSLIRITSALASLANTGQLVVPSMTINNKVLFLPTMRGRSYLLST